MIKDNDPILSDSSNGGLQTLDTDGEQTVVDITGLNLIGNEIFSYGNIEINNITTGETGRLYVLANSTSGFGNAFYATTVILNEGDTVEWTASSSSTIHSSPVFFVGQVPYSELFSSYVSDVGYCEGIDTDGDGLADHLDVDSDNDGIPDIDDENPYLVD